MLAAMITLFPGGMHPAIKQLIAPSKYLSTLPMNFAMGTDWRGSAIAPASGFAPGPSGMPSFPLSEDPTVKVLPAAGPWLRDLGPVSWSGHTRMLRPGNKIVTLQSNRLSKFENGSNAETANLAGFQQAGVWSVHAQGFQACSKAAATLQIDPRRPISPSPSTSELGEDFCQHHARTGDNEGELPDWTSDGCHGGCIISASACMSSQQGAWWAACWSC